MKKKIIGFLVSVLLTTVLFSMVASAGTEEDPEIEDEEDNIFDYIDAVSGWFYEKEDESEYLYVSLKLVDLTEHIGTVYAIHWKYNDVHYDVGLHNGIFIPRITEKHWSCNYYEPSPIWFWREVPIGTWNSSSCSGSFDVDTEIITWKIHKNCIGNPQPGNELIRPHIFTAHRISKIGLIPFIGPISYQLSDATSMYESKNYTIQY